MTFVKGVSGNPGGRPKKDWTWAGLYIQELKRKLKTTDGKKIDPKVAIAKRIIKMAIDGDLNAIKELSNRIDGMPQQSMEHSGEIANPTPIYGSKSTE